MKITKILLLTIFCLFYSLGLYAKSYQIPADLIVEIKQNREIISANPTSAEAYFELAMSYAYTGLVEWGLAALGKVKDNDPNYAPKVIEKYENLSQKEPDNWKHKFKLAFGYYFIEDKENAEKQFVEIIAKYPNNIWAKGYLALLKGDKIITIKDELKKKNAGNQEIKNIINPMCDEIIAICKEALKIEPNATAIHFLLGQAYYNKSDYFGVFGEGLMVLQLKSEDKKFLEQNGLYQL